MDSQHLDNEGGTHMESGTDGHGEKRKEPDEKDFAPPDDLIKRRDNKIVVTSDKDEDDDDDQYDEFYVFETAGGDDDKGLEAAVVARNHKGSEAEKRIYTLKKEQELYDSVSEDDPNYHSKRRIRATLTRNGEVLWSMMRFIS
ncbi:unnamed protein product [Cuscuta epithymum]|uniref:Uncharacterized protein n=1 Tax=Cuscuta epithymum TaxID=186058 RepID=A0AAV0G9D1_9ASTE|nr:unnamed protein product [Cuscuta epithymum]